MTGLPRLGECQLRDLDVEHCLRYLPGQRSYASDLVPRVQVPGDFVLFGSIARPLIPRPRGRSPRRWRGRGRSGDDGRAGTAGRPPDEREEMFTVLLAADVKAGRATVLDDQPGGERRRGRGGLSEPALGVQPPGQEVV